MRQKLNCRLLDNDSCAYSIFGYDNKRDVFMNKMQKNKFDLLCKQYVNALHREGKAESTIDIYVRTVKRITAP